ncbi:MAG: hypothetical protein ABH808_00650 [Candidatus Kuenenbacteria bacterium]
MKNFINKFLPIVKSVFNGKKLKTIIFFSALTLLLLTVSFTPLSARTINMLKTISTDVFKIFGSLVVEKDLEVKGTVKVLGDWETKTADTIYQAPTDGFVTFYCSGSKCTCELYGYTDSNSSPSTLKTRSIGHNGSSFPVKKGDYWKVSKSQNGTPSIYWIPLGR